jgi:anti-anti-sigma factor
MTTATPATGRIHTGRVGATHLVCCHGDLDPATTSRLRAALRDTYTTDPADLLVDTRDVTWAGSAALGVLTAANRRAGAHGHTLTLANPPGHLVRTLRTTGLHRVLQVTQCPAGSGHPPCR